MKYIGFDIDIEVAYKYLRLFEESDYFQSQGLAKTTLIDISKRFVNDSLLTTMCLYFQPYVIALAAISMSSLYLETEISDMPDGFKWFQVFDTSIEYEYLMEAVGVLKRVY